MPLLQSIVATIRTLEGKLIELRTHKGSQGYIIEQAKQKPDGTFEKSFSKATPRPIPSDQILDTLKKVINDYILTGATVEDSTIPFTFDTVLGMDLTSVIRREEEFDRLDLMSKLESDSFAVQALPATSRRIILLFDTRATYAVTAFSLSGQCVSIPQNVLRTLCGVSTVLQNKRTIIEARYTLQGHVTFTDLLFHGCALTDRTLDKRLELLSSLIVPMPPYRNLTTTETELNKKHRLLKQCTTQGLDCVLIPRGLLQPLAGGTNKVNYKMKLKHETALQVMSVDLQKNSVALCAQIGGIPIKLAEAPVPTDFVVEALDNVQVKYSEAVVGELLNVEIVAKLDGDDALPLNPVLAHTMGFNLKPKAIESSRENSGQLTGILAALDEPQL